VRGFPDRDTPGRSFKGQEGPKIRLILLDNAFITAYDTTQDVIE
jgi:hypothetical protein